MKLEESTIGNITEQWSLFYIERTVMDPKIVIPLGAVRDLLLRSVPPDEYGEMEDTQEFPSNDAVNLCLSRKN